MDRILIANNFGYFPTLPPFSTASIVGLLKANGLKAEHLDINLAIWEWLLDPQFLNAMQLRTRVTNDSRLWCCPPIKENKFSVLKSNVLENIAVAKNIMRHPNQFYDLKKLMWAANIIMQAQQVIYYHYGTFISNKVIFWPNIGFNVNSMKAIYDLSMDRERNPFIEIIESKILPRLLSLSPRIIGLDIVFPWEVIQAVTLNKLIKRDAPEIHINFAGHGFDEFCFARLRNRLANNKDYFLCFDSVFLVRNDEELIALYSKDDYSETRLSEIGSLAFKVGERITINGPYEEGTICSGVTPDYSGLPLNKYYSPELVIADKLSNKCFWSKCSYCNINTYKNHRQEVPVDDFIERIKSYQKNYQCTHLFLLDEAATPKLAADFSQKLMENHTDITWSIRTRIDKRYDEDLLKKMYLSGCREMWIGLETVSERLLKLMNKTDNPSTYVSNAKHLMKMCNKIGVGLHFCLLLGYPTETEDERDLLMAFFKEMLQFINRVPFFVTYNQFSLNIGSPMYRNYQDYSIEEITENEDLFGMINIPYKMHGENESDSNEEVLSMFADRLTSMLVKSEALTFLWFFAGDSSWELLLKSRFSSKNPFQLDPSFLEKTFVRIFRRIEKVPFLLKWWNLTIDKQPKAVESQFYR